MGMNLGSAASGGEPEVMMDINTTPLIDVMLVLLIMLIITIPIQLHAVSLNLPVGKPPATEIQPEVVRIDIDERSVLHWQGVAISGDAELEAKLQAAAAQAVVPDIQLRPNKAAQYAVVAKVLAETRRLGLTKIGVLGSEQFVEN